MAQTYKFGKDGTWATKKGSTLAYSDTNNAFKPLPFNFTRNSIATRVNKEGLIEVVGNDIPRIDYTDSTEGALLLENSSTNLITYSEAFDNAYWTKSGSNVTSGFISPDGTANAFKLVESTGNSAHTITSSAGVTTSLATTTKSIFVKPNGRRWILLLDIYKPSSRAWFDLELGVVGSKQSSAISSNIEKLSNGYFRCSVTSAVNGTSSQLRMDIVLDNNSTSGYQGDGTSGVYIYGAQLEIGNASSYIPTNGSTVQRAAETCNDSGNSEVFNSEQGVLFANIAALSDDSSYKTLSLNDNSASDRIQISINSNNIYIGVIDGGSTQVFDSVSVTDATNFNKVVVSYKVNDCNLWINGFKVFTDTNASMPSGLSKINFDKGDGGDDFYGKTKEIAYYDTALTDAELETLTSYRSLNEMVTELNLNAL